MAVYEITHPPINGARVALWARLNTNGNTSGYNLLKEGVETDFPYLAVGPGYQGAGGSDPDVGVNAIVQIEAYAKAKQGGSKKVDDMMEDVFAAISSGPITFDSFKTLPPIIEEYVINPDQRDPVDGEFFAQAIARFRFIVTT